MKSTVRDRTIRTFAFSLAAIGLGSLLAQGLFCLTADAWRPEDVDFFEWMWARLLIVKGNAAERAGFMLLIYGRAFLSGVFAAVFLLCMPRRDLWNRPPLALIAAVAPLLTGMVFWSLYLAIGWTGVIAYSLLAAILAGALGEIIGRAFWPDRATTSAEPA